MKRAVQTQVETGWPAGQPTRTRWSMLAWLCSFAAVTYIGRIGIIQVEAPIQRDLRLTPVQLGYAFAAFSLAYALVEVPSGWLGDKIGPRKVLIRIALFWIAFTALTGLAWGLISLVVFRFLFGIGEAGAFPNIGRASREWFPFHERGFAQGMVWLSARWGGAIAPLIMLVLAYPLGWRGGFVMMALIGVVWLWGFRSRYGDTPNEHPAVNAAELALINEGRRDDAVPPPLSWSTMLTSPTLWFLSLMYFCSNAGWSFFASWITPYLRTGLHFSGVKLGLASGGPLFVGGIACLLGGFFTDRQVRVWGRRWGRTLQGAVGYAIAGVFMLAGIALSARHPAIRLRHALPVFVREGFRDRCELGRHHRRRPALFRHGWRLHEYGGQSCTGDQRTARRPVGDVGRPAGTSELECQPLLLCGDVFRCVDRMARRRSPPRHRVLERRCPVGATGSLVATSATVSDGDGVVAFPAGSYQCLSIHLKSNVSLYLGPSQQLFRFFRFRQTKPECA